MRNSLVKLALMAAVSSAVIGLVGVVRAALPGADPNHPRAAVEKRFPGALVGKSTTVYAFEVTQGGNTQTVLVNASTNKVLPEAPQTRRAVRYGSVIKLKPGALRKYSKLHSAVWPDVKKMITACNIRNYSIYYKDGYLFSYFEYVGTNYDKDMARMAADRTTQRWWAVCKPLQRPLKTRKKGEWWASMPELFHED